MRHRFRFSEDARRDLADLDDRVRNRIILKLRWYSEQENSLKFAKRLVASDYGAFRFRIGDYRALCDVEFLVTETVIQVLRIRHRREAYD